MLEGEYINSHGILHDASGTQGDIRGDLQLDGNYFFSRASVSPMPKRLIRHQRMAPPPSRN